MSNLKGVFSRESDHWRTPPDIYNFFMDRGYKDPCPFMADFDGLKLEFKNEKIFINPPYSQIKLWVDYSLKMLGGGVKLCFLYLQEQRPNTFIFSWATMQNYYSLRVGYISTKAKTARHSLLCWWCWNGVGVKRNILVSNLSKI